MRSNADPVQSDPLIQRVAGGAPVRYDTLAASVLDGVPAVSSGGDWPVEASVNRDAGGRF